MIIFYYDHALLIIYFVGMAQPAVAIVNQAGQFVYWWAAAGDASDGGGAKDVR